MGTWGKGIIGDDTGADVLADFLELYDKGSTPAEARSTLEQKYQDTIHDPDDTNAYWFALAKGQWDIGALDDDVLQKVRDIIASGSELKNWKDRDASDADIKKRATAIHAFLSKIEVPNTKPRKRKKTVLRNSPFERGDILAVQLPGKGYGACIVTKADKQTELGMTAVVETDLYTDSMPTSVQVQKANVLFSDFSHDAGRVRATYYFAQGFKRVADLFTVLGHTRLKDGIEEPVSYSGWQNLPVGMEARLQREKAASTPQKRITVQEYLGE